MATAHDVALHKSPVQNNKTAIFLNFFIVFVLAIIRDCEETAFQTFSNFEKSIFSQSQNRNQVGKNLLEI